MLAVRSSLTTVVSSSSYSWIMSNTALVTILERLTVSFNSIFGILYLISKRTRHATTHSFYKKSNLTHTLWKAPQEMSQPCGLLFSGIILLVPKEI